MTDRNCVVCIARCRPPSSISTVSMSALCAECHNPLGAHTYSHPHHMWMWSSDPTARTCACSGFVLMRATTAGAVAEQLLFAARRKSV